MSPGRSSGRRFEPWRGGCLRDYIVRQGLRLPGRDRADSGAGDSLRPAVGLELDRSTRHGPKHTDGVLGGRLQADTIANGFSVLHSTESSGINGKRMLCCKTSYLAKADHIRCSDEVEPVGQDDAGKT